MSAARPCVLDVGNCDPDHGRIRVLLERRFAVAVDRVMFVPEALARLADRTYALVLVNRLIFADGSDGLKLIEAMQADGRLRGTPVMMVSNFPDAQARAVAAGAVPGFGKAALDAPETLARLARYLPTRAPAAAGPI